MGISQVKLATLGMGSEAKPQVTFLKYFLHLPRSVDQKNDWAVKMELQILVLPGDTERERFRLLTKLFENKWRVWISVIKTSYPGP